VTKWISHAMFQKARETKSHFLPREFLKCGLKDKSHVPRLKIVSSIYQNCRFDSFTELSRLRLSA